MKKDQLLKRQELALSSFLNKKDYKREDAGPLKIVTYTANVKGKDRPTVIIFSGNSTKPMIHVCYPDEENRGAAIQRAIKGTWEHLKRIQDKRERNKEVNASDHYKIGEIIFNSWGYDQTNIDFFQVTEVKNKTIRIQAIKKEYKEEGVMCGHSIPVPGEFLDMGQRDSVYLLSVRVDSNGKPYLSGGASYYYFSKWDRTPQYESHYA